MKLLQFPRNSIFTTIKRQMDPQSFGLSKHRKFLLTHGPFMTQNQKLYKQSTQASHYKKAEKVLEKKEDIFPEEQFDQKMFLKQFESKTPQSIVLQQNMIKTNATLINPEFSPSIFYNYSPQFQQPKLVSQSNSMYQAILSEKNTIQKNNGLVEQIQKLKNLGLLKDYKRNFKQFQGRFKIDFVYNDFHSKATNPGYARNGYGSFYTS